MEKELDLFKFDESFVGQKQTPTVKKIDLIDGIMMIDKCGVRTCWGGKCNSICKE